VTAGQTHTFSREIEGQTFEISAGTLAPNALAAVTVRIGDTVLLVTVCDGEPRAGIDFFPLTIDFEERMYAIGKIPGSFFRREGRPGTDATLAARMTDRPIRPLFPKGYKREVQVVCTVLASDREHPADALATTGASTVINMSTLPFEGPVSSVNVGRIDGELVAFPTYTQRAESDLDLTVAATDDSIVMIEAGAKEIPEDELIDALAFAEGVCRELNALQREVIEALGAEKDEFVAPEGPDPELVAACEQYLADLGEAAFEAVQGEGFRGIDDLARRASADLVDDEGEPLFDPRGVRSEIDNALKRLVRRRVLEENTRADGRPPEQIRNLSAQVGVLPRVHGSGLFQRGETQILTVATLGAIRDRQRLDDINPTEWKRFMHHYNFPPFSVGEARFLRGPGRREIGHGMLGEKAMAPVLPDLDEFPYTIRLVSDALGSNGSTSQGSICGSTLALMDAGVPITAPVAGIAMGLVTDEDLESYKILTDIAGIEDAFGDMDFKVAGTEQGVTAVQLDIKLKRLPDEFLHEVFDRARSARLELLEVMQQAIDEPREEVGRYAPKITVIKINPEKIGAVIGPGGRVINGIIEETGATIDVEEDGTVYVGGTESESVTRAVAHIEGLTKEIEVGEVYTGPVSRIMSFGAFVEILPGKDGMVHISELAEGRVDRVEDVVDIGDEVTVRVIEIDNLGRVNLSMRGTDGDGAVGMTDEETASAEGARAGGGDRETRGSRGGGRDGGRDGGRGRGGRDGGRGGRDGGRGGRGGGGGGRGRDSRGGGGGGGRGRDSRGGGGGGGGRGGYGGGRDSNSGGDSNGGSGRSSDGGSSGGGDRGGSRERSSRGGGGRRW
jgi:polyribonucleotide nucleotidyltransferase